MSEIVVHVVAKTQPGQLIPKIGANQAVSCLVPFDKVRDLLANSPPPRRPNRNRPLSAIDPVLREELGAWDAASDEALEVLEDNLPE